MVDDVPVDSETPEEVSSISRICWLSLSEELIGVELCACIHKVEHASVYMNVYVSIVFCQKKSVYLSNYEVLSQKTPLPVSNQYSTYSFSFGGEHNYC